MQAFYRDLIYYNAPNEGHSGQIRGYCTLYRALMGGNLTKATLVEKYFLWDSEWDSFPSELVEKRTYDSGHIRWFVKESRWYQTEKWNIDRWRKAGILYQDNDDNRDIIRRKNIDKFIKIIDKL